MVFEGKFSVRPIQLELFETAANHAVLRQLSNQFGGETVAPADISSLALLPGERCASTSNRNFEGRQGRGGRTHLLSPAMAAAAGIEGKLTDVRKFL